MTSGWGTGGWGSITPWGSVGVSSPVPAIVSLGEFDFNVVAKSEGFTIRIEFSTPSVADAPLWSRRLIILRKRGEWPRSWDDSEAYTTLDNTYSSEGSYWIEESDLIEGEIYYYALYTLRNDGAWINNIYTDRGSAYPYDRWGCATYLYDSLPRGWRSEDARGTGDLEDFTTIFGAILDDAKTDGEHLQTLFDIDAIHDDLIYLLDNKIGWPTWYAANGLKRREETANAVSLYKLLGRTLAYENMLSGVSDWDVEIVEGWKYVMWSNGLYGSTTPDMTNIYLQTRIGWIDDYLKYTNYLDGWPGVNGLRFYMSEIPGVSGELTQDMWVRFGELVEWGKASYVSTSIVVIPTSEEIWLHAATIEWWLDAVWTYTELPFPMAIDTDVGATTSSCSVFLSNAILSITNSVSDRTYHNELEYV